MLAKVIWRLIPNLSVFLLFQLLTHYWYEEGKQRSLGDSTCLTSPARFLGLLQSIWAKLVFFFCTISAVTSSILSLGFRGIGFPPDTPTGLLCCYVVRNTCKGDKDKLEYGQRGTQRGVRILELTSWEKWLKDPKTCRPRRPKSIAAHCRGEEWLSEPDLGLLLPSSHSSHRSVPV